MGEGNKYRKGIEKPPDGTIPSGEFKEIIKQQGGPSVDLPVEEKEEADLFPEEKEKLAKHIQSVLLGYDYVECLKKEKYKASKKENEEIIKLVKEDLDKSVDYLISYLVGEYGVKSIKKSISDDKFPEVEYFEDKIHELAKCYYHIYLQKIEKPNLRQADDLTRLDLEDYPDDVLEAVSEILSKVNSPETEKKEARETGDDIKDPKEIELFEKIKVAVDERLRFVLEKISGLAEEQKKALGIDEAELQGGIENLKSVELQKIYEWSQGRFGGSLKDEIADPKKFENWINYYVDSAFTVHGNEAMKKAYERTLENKTISAQEVPGYRPDYFNEDEERFLNFYLKKYQEEIVSFFELVKSDEEIEKFKKSLIYNIKETRKWAIKRGFEEKKADIVKERLERDVMDFFEEKEREEEFVPTPGQMNYIRKMTEFLDEFSKGISKIVEEKGQQDSWTDDDLEKQLRTTTEGLCQKYFIGKEGYKDLFKGDDFKKLVDVAVKKYSRRKLKK